jgi:glyoxylase-like metal-dependent hydrolase (beta-lactamase superfamily II)
VQTIQTSTYKISLLSDGTTYGDGAGPFGLVPRPKWVKLLPPDDQNRVPMELWCPLIEADGKRILVDCGCGNKDMSVLSTQYDLRRPNGTLIDALARMGLSPEDIDIVILTHLHGDHSGWATKFQGESDARKVIPTFPNAIYFVRQQEYEDATHPNERTRNTYFPDNFKPLQERGVLSLLTLETRITPHVSVVPTPGHCLGHQSVIVEGERNERPTFILGDLACYMIHFARLAWVTAYDVFPMTTIDTKREWQQWALANNPYLISAHDTTIPIGTFKQDQKGFFEVVRADV